MTRPQVENSFLVVAAILLLSPSSAIGQRFVGPITTSQVKFERGRTTAVIKGIAKTPGTHEYVLRVRSGQTMTAHLTSSNKGVEFSVETPNGEWVDDALGVTAWSGRLQFSGQYKLLLTNNRSKSQGEPTYTLEMVTEALNVQESVSNGSGMIGLSGVWKAPQRALNRIVECRPGSVQCLTSVMRQFGASSQAVKFSTLLKRDGSEGYMDSFREMGRVDLAVASCPFRANTNSVYLLVNGTPPVVETNLTGEYQKQTDDTDERKRIDIKTSPLYRSLASAFPNLTLELDRNRFESMRRPSEGGQEFVFSYALTNGCRACEVVGYAHVGYDFDGAGNFLGTKLLRLSRGRADQK